MTGFRKLALFASMTALPLSLAVGWLWHGSHEPEYIARARITIPAAAGIRAPTDSTLPNLEEMFLAPDVVMAAIDLLAERGSVLPVDPAADSEVNFVLNRVETACAHRGNEDEIEIRYRAADGDRALATLSALADAGLAALRSQIPAVEDPAAGGREREHAQISRACDDLQSRVAALKDEIARRDAATGNEPPRGGQTALETALEEVRQLRVDAEDHLADARRRIRSGADAASIVADLPDEPHWGALRESLAAIQCEAELRQKDAAHDSAAAIYGRNHPRMARLKAEIDQLREKLAGLKPRVSDSAGSLLLASDVLLKALEDKWQQAAAAEQEAQAKLEDAREAHEREQGLDARLADARQELAFLKTEQDRVKYEIAEARREAESRLPGLAEPPALEEEPITPELTAYLIWAGAAGLFLAALFWRLAGRTSDRTRPARVTRGARHHGRTLSREEDNLARLRRLKSAA
jgi:hypothetical protein